MFRSGAFVADQLGDLDPEQVQPNGVDLRLDSVLEPTAVGSITRSGKTIADRTPVETVSFREDRNQSIDRNNGDDVVGQGGEEDGFDSAGGNDTAERVGYYLEPGGYILQYAEPVSIPAEHVGFVLPRSSLMRNGAMLNTAVWDAGYSGRGEGLLQVHNDIRLETGARVAQLVLAAADHEDVYTGSYQGERLDRV